MAKTQMTPEDKLQLKLILYADLWAEAHLRSPMDPSKPLSLRDYQRDALRDNHNRLLFRWGRRCIAGNDTIYTNKGPVTVEELHRNPEEYQIYTLDADTFTLRPTADFEIWYNAPVRTITLRTQRGYKQTVSFLHPFLIIREGMPIWEFAQNLQIGDFVATVNVNEEYLDEAPIAFEPIIHLERSQFFEFTDTYHIHVPGTENFLGNGIIQHNTGKSVTLSIRALHRAFTYSNRQVLLIAAYESQIENLFDLIRRMAWDSDIVRTSIERQRRKPYEIWFKNGSVIRGMVATSAVRGKCLIEGTQVWMADGTWKDIIEVKEGDEVISWDMENARPVQARVVNFYENGIKDIYELRTTSARRIIATDNHPFFVFGKGWMELKDIKTVEDDKSDANFIAIVDIFGELRWSRVLSIKYLGSAPTYDIEVETHHNFIAFFPNEVDESGFKVSGLSNGGILVHNSADDLIIDEADYIPNKLLLEDIWPIATTFKHTSVVLSSTPSGRRDFFYTVSKNKNLPEFNFHEYHIPSSRSPEWTEETEKFVLRTTTRSQYIREYEADFGEETEGVFRHSDIDKSLYVYGYDKLKQKKENYYTLGVDWNEARNGVEIVIVEYMKTEEKLPPYNDGKYRLNKKVKVKDKLRLFRVWNIDALDYTNTFAVDTVLDILSNYRIDYAHFDKGHGQTNWEILRLAIKNGVSPTGKRVAGLKHMLDKMDVVDFGGLLDIIDPVTNETNKHPVKNFLVEMTASLFENNSLVIPAVDENGEPVENDERKLVAQLREYSVARRGKRGDVYEAGPSGDHRLDAYMLAIFAYIKNHNSLLSYNFDLKPNLVSNESLITQPATSRIIIPTDYEIYNISNAHGITKIDWGYWSKKGEPPDIFPDESTGERDTGLIPSGFKHKRRTKLFTKRGGRNL